MHLQIKVPQFTVPLCQCAACYQ